MWMRVTENRSGGTMLTEDVENLLYAAALLAACVELAVGISSRTTFSKAIVTLGIYALVA